MSGSKRVLFTFDPRNYQALQHLTSTGSFSSTADAVRGAVLVSRVLQSQALQGFTEVVVRNPRTKEERVLVVPEFSVSEVTEKTPVEVSK